MDVPGGLSIGYSVQSWLAEAAALSPFSRDSQLQSGPGADMEMDAAVELLCSHLPRAELASLSEELGAPGTTEPAKQAAVQVCTTRLALSLTSAGHTPVAARCAFSAIYLLRITPF